MNELQRFKCILEYFVAHLEYIQTEDTSIKGYSDYIDSKLPLSTKTGHGYKGGKIQQYIKQWAEFPLGHICINVQSNHGHNYTSSKCYLNWYAKQPNKSTGYKIFTKWQSNRIVALRLSNYKYWFNPPIWEDSIEMTVSDLGLYDKNEPNENLKQFFAEFTSYIQNFTQFRAMEPILQLIESNHNIILHGAPGTGKTFKAKQIAKQLNAETKFVQFHPSYDYTDFVEGLRPIKDGNSVGFERKDGVFKAFCKKALKAYNETADKTNVPKYVFIIDEINRGDMSKIFGELFFSIDPGYRGTDGKVDTQYQNLIGMDSEDEFKDGFYIPENVYIIGTMNDIDRSVESMDFAMRRRFTFCEITAEQSANSMGIPYDENSPMKKLNDEIVKTEGLGKDFQIGGAYLKDYKDKLDDITSLQEVWNMKIGPLVKEYLRGIDNNGSIYSKFKESFVGEKAK